MRRVISAIGLAVLVLAVGAWADVIELPLDCAGTYDINTPAWNYNFDLGVTFSEISNVYIDWSGEAVANLIVDSLGSSPRPMGATIMAYVDLGSYPQHAYAIVGGGVCLHIQTRSRSTSEANFSSIIVHGQRFLTVREILKSITICQSCQPQ